MRSVFWTPCFYTGRLLCTHSAPHPVRALGVSVVPGNFFAPLIRYAFSFSPYRNGSFPRTIPHSINKAALPVTKGVAKEVPVKARFPTTTDTPGAHMSGLEVANPDSDSVYPLPENAAYELLSALYAPTDMAREAVDGIVKVFSLSGERKPVEGLIAPADGSHIL